ncbi:MAG: metallophosphoesterase [Anaerolineae bacterium]
MTRAVWLTDIHLNFLTPVKLDKLFTLVNQTQPDYVLISGDITEAPRLEWSLKLLEKRIRHPIYYVLGNHDYYSGSFDDVYALARRINRAKGGLTWLSDGGILELAAGVGLIGYDGWADGRCGDYEHSEIVMKDYLAIQDFRGLNKGERLHKLNQLGDATAAFLHEWLPKAFDQYATVVLLTHVPPFRETCWHEGGISGDEWLPHFVCQAAGEALVEIMRRFPTKNLIVLCGHSHGRGEVHVMPNLKVLTGGAEYGRPEVQQVFEW